MEALVTFALAFSVIASPRLALESPSVDFGEVAAAAALVSDGSVTNSPVFNRGFSPMFDRNASLDNQWLALAKYVPAVSGAMGGRAVARNVGENVNMNLDEAIGGVPRPNRWGRGSPDWHHSDMKDMAYFYVYELYEQLIHKGDLK